MTPDAFTVLVYGLYYGIPIMTVLLFVVSLYRFCIAKFRNKRRPGTYPAEEIRHRKIMLIISSVIFGILAAVVIAFIVLLMCAVAFM